MFMELAMCAAMPVGGHTREAALQALGECGGDVRAATLRLMARPADSHMHDQRWAPDEVEAFLAALQHYDKDFYRISQLVRYIADSCQRSSIVFHPLLILWVFSSTSLLSHYRPLYSGQPCKLTRELV